MTRENHWIGLTSFRKLEKIDNKKKAVRVEIEIGGGVMLDTRGFDGVVMLMLIEALMQTRSQTE